MKLHEENLKKIITEIEKYGVVESIEIFNDSCIIKVPSNINSKPSKVREIDLNKPKDFIIKFTMGDIKE